MKAWIGVFIVILAVLCEAGAGESNRIKVSQDGVTEVLMKTGKVAVTIKITTHKLDIGTPAETRPEQRLTNCTYSRFPCSLVDNVEIFVGAEPLFVARSVYADLADIVGASIRETKPGLYVLSMNGGDGAEGYAVKVTFDRSRIRLRELSDRASGEIRQRTTYLPQPSLN